MSQNLVYAILVFSLVADNSDCDFCSDKKSEKLKYFDGTRRNLLTTAPEACRINYFDIEFISRLTLSVVHDEASLRILDLSSNRISAISNGTFSLFPQLENLKLCDNFLTEVLSHCFNGLKELSILDLSSNLIGKVDENSFVALESLLWLSLADNCIINLAINIPICTLDSLDLSHNLIESFPHFINIGAIDSLDLSNNTNGVLNISIDGKFSELERGRIAKFATRVAKSIKSLNIADNHISSLTQLKPFINLDELNLAGNPIDYTANVFPRLMDLEKLNLTSTNMTSLDVLDSFNAKQFQELSFGRNPLKSDFKAMEKFSNLQHLQFSASFCYEFESYRDIRRNFQHLTHVSVLYEVPNCKCAKRNKKLFSLYHIKFSTDWHLVCSGGSTRRYIGVAYLSMVIAIRKLIQL